MTETPAELRARLNAETGRIGWQELAPHFARGAVVRVVAELDLVEVAAAFAENQHETVQQWLAGGKVARADDRDAERWTADKPTFWAVVAAPWVLVQETDKK